MNILIKPVITEKMTDESEKYNRFGFIVDRRANKLEIKDAPKVKIFRSDHRLLRSGCSKPNFSACSPSLAAGSEALR